MTRAVPLAITACLLAALLETVCAGSKARERTASLRLPRYSVPLGGWIVIGGIYYAICFAILTRLFSVASPRPVLALSLLGAVMILNALWNVFFFRTRDLRHAFLLSIAYSAIAIALLIVLFMRDRIAALCFSPYVVYLTYANVWGYRIWQLNRPNR